MAFLCSILHSHDAPRSISVPPEISEIFPSVPSLVFHGHLFPAAQISAVRWGLDFFLLFIPEVSEPMKLSGYRPPPPGTFLISCLFAALLTVNARIRIGKKRSFTVSGGIQQLRVEQKRVVALGKATSAE